VQRVKIAELKNNLSRLLDQVRGGETVVVMDGDQPIARIVPFVADQHLARLERRGVLRRGRGRLPKWLGKRKPARVKGSVLADLLAERDQGE
jgi:prevent-host-death family protein